MKCWVQRSAKRCANFVKKILFGPILGYFLILLNCHPEHQGRARRPRPRRLRQEEGAGGGRQGQAQRHLSGNQEHGRLQQEVQRGRGGGQEGRGGQGTLHGCQMAIAGLLDRMCLALWASGLWLRYAALQILIPSFPWIAPPRPPPWHNTRKGRDQILHCSVGEP